MDLEWTYQYCLACDKQTDGVVYCTEACRLADHEKSPLLNMLASTPPEYAGSPSPWAAPRQPQPKPQASLQPHPRQQEQLYQPPKFFLPPAYDFGNAAPYGTTPRPASFIFQKPSFQPAVGTPMPASPYRRGLTPSSSQSSLSSLRSSASAGSLNAPNNRPHDGLSEQTRRELREYASTFEHVKFQRRRSY